MNLQEAFKSAVAAAESILTEAGENPLTPEQKAAYDGHVTKAQAIKAQIEQKQALDALKTWANEPDGQSAVKQSWSGQAVNPNEGNVDGVTADAKSGEMYALNGVGEQKLAALKSGAYKDAFNDYIRSVGLGRSLKSASMKVLNEGADNSGGFWVPPEYRPELIKKIAAMSAVRPNAFSFVTGSDIAKFPKVSYTADDIYTSGVRFGWNAPLLSADISEATNPVAAQTTIPVHTATAAIIATREQLEDNQFDLLGYINMLMSEAFALGEEDAFISGDGVGKPQGMLSHANVSTIYSSGGMKVLSGAAGALAWGTSSSASTATTGIVGIEAALPPQYEANAKWLGNKRTWAAVRGLVDSSGRPLWNPVEAWPTLTNGQAATLLGYPVLKSQLMPAISATTYPIIFGDLSGYYIADRVGLSIEVYRELRALRGEVVIYARKRLGGQLVHDWRIKAMLANNA